MLLIISQSYEVTTEEVCRWLRHEGIPYVRMHPEDLEEGDVHYLLNPGAEASMDVTVTAVDGQTYQAADFTAVWYRRWHRPRRTKELWAKSGEPALDKVRAHLNNEFATLTQTFVRHLGDVCWLNHPSDNNINKIDVLEKASRAGFAVPETLVTGRREVLDRFVTEHSSVISKPIKEVDFFPYHGQDYSLYTTRFTQEDVQALPEKFFPTLFQREISKQYEIRTFFLDDQCHSMAIFSQADNKTALDYRQYNHAHMNQMVPFSLPEEVQSAVRKLMNELGMASGSLDIIRDNEGRYVFLEVNPIGQFGMVSKPCNYYLEEKVASYLKDQIKK